MKKILIVDDEPNVRKLVALTLQKTREVILLSAGDGREGLRMAAQERPDLIFLDIMMPEMDGPALAALKENPQTQNIPVIFLTSLVEKDETQKTSLGEYRFMAKPFDPKELVSVVDELFGVGRGGLG